jgi:flagellar basal body L-ring protein FlgH
VKPHRHTDFEDDRNAKIRASPIPILALLVVSLTGCAWIPPTPLVQGATTAQPVPGPTPVANGSIFQSAQPINYGYQPLFEDRRPRNIGDTLTIVLQENVSASKALRRTPAATARQTLALIPYRAICKVCSVTNVPT